MMQPGSLALCNYGEHPVCWHTRLLLAWVNDNNWIVLTPDEDRYEEQMDGTNEDFVDFEFLGSSTNVPARISAASVYGFGPLAAGDLAYHMNQARLEANALRLQRGLPPLPPPGGQVVQPPPLAPPPPAPPAGLAPPGMAPAPAALDPYVWIAVETAGGRSRGDIICVEPGTLPVGHVVLGSRAVIPDLNGGADSCFVRRVLQSQSSTYKLEDLRTLPVHFDPQGLRRRDFASAVPLMVEAIPQGGGLQLEGPPTALNIAKNLRDQAMTPTSYHEFWIRTADIPKGDRSVYEHECLSRIFESMICVDQLNPSGLQSVELVVRRMQVIREAHRISPSAPDYSAADHFMGWKFKKQAQGVDASLAAHVANELKTEAAIAKEARKAREEQQNRRRPGKKDNVGGGEAK